MTSTEDCRGCSPCAWTSGQGSDCPITPDKLNFTSTKKTVVLLMHILWQRSVQISPNSSAHYQQQFFPTNISECSQRNQSNKADTWVAQFYRRVNNNLNFKWFFSMVCICFDRTNFMHEMVFILCIQSAIRRRAAVIMTSQTEEEFKKRVQKCSLIPTQILPRGLPRSSFSAENHCHLKKKESVPIA